MSMLIKKIIGILLGIGLHRPLSDRLQHASGRAAEG